MFHESEKVKLCEGKGFDNPWRMHRDIFRNVTLCYLSLALVKLSLTLLQVICLLQISKLPRALKWYEETDTLSRERPLRYPFLSGKRVSCGYVGKEDKNVSLLVTIDLWIFIVEFTLSLLEKLIFVYLDFRNWRLKVIR